MQNSPLVRCVSYRGAKLMGQGYTIPSLHRGMMVLEYVAERENPVSFTELAEQLTIPKTTLFRILHSFVTDGWLEKKSDQYTLGHKAIRIGVKFLTRLQLNEVAVPHMDRLSKLTGETSYLEVLSGKSGLRVAVCDGPRHIRIASRVGAINELHCSAPGKILLAYTVKEDLHTFFEGMELDKKTERTITDIDSLIDEVALTKRRGYALDNREYHNEVRCLAVPVYDAFGNVIAGVGITAAVTSFTMDMVDSIYEQVKEAAEGISKDLGAAGRQAEKIKK